MASCFVAYSPRYDIKAFGLEKLHSFDGRKYGKAWALLERRFGATLEPAHLGVDREISRGELLKVHSEAYLENLRKPLVLARAFELPPVAKLPGWLSDRLVLRPMRWASRGTYLAAKAALDHGCAVNLSGGYHHAKKESGEGFTIYSDIAVAIALLRAEGLLDAEAPFSQEQRIGVIDLDAHQCNGIKSIFADDASVTLLDVFNCEIYPPDRFELVAPSRDVKVRSGISTEDYLSRVHQALPLFLDELGPCDLVFYIAGTDIYAEDALGRMAVSFDGVVERDLFVTEQLTAAAIPWVMVLGGGYTEASHRMIAESVGAMIEKWPIR